MPEEDLKVLFGEKISADDIFEKLEDKKGEGVRRRCLYTGYCEIWTLF